MELTPERIGLFASIAGSLYALWRALKSSGKDARKEQDERMLELFKIHIFPRIDKISTEVESCSRRIDETKRIIDEVVPTMAQAIVKQSIETATQQMYAMTEKMIRLKEEFGR